MRSNLRSFRIEVIHNALAVNTESDCFADFQLVKRLESVGHRQIHNVRRGKRDNNQIISRLYHCDIFFSDVGNVVNRAGLQLKQAGCRFCGPAENQGVSMGSLAPVIIEFGEDNAVSSVPGFQFISASSNRGFKHSTAAACLCVIFSRLNREGGERHLGNEGGVRFTQYELNSVFV